MRLQLSFIDICQLLRDIKTVFVSNEFVCVAYGNILKGIQSEAVLFDFKHICEFALQFRVCYHILYQELQILLVLILI